VAIDDDDDDVADRDFARATRIDAHHRNRISVAEDDELTCGLAWVGLMQVPAEASRAFVRELLAEAEFYQVEGLIAILAPDDHGATSSGAAAPAFAFTFSSSAPTRHVTHLALSLSLFSPSLSSLSWQLVILETSTAATICLLLFLLYCCCGAHLLT
jgi:hypothetical protein